MDARLPFHGSFKQAFRDSSQLFMLHSFATTVDAEIVQLLLKLACSTHEQMFVKSVMRKKVACNLL